MINRLMQGVLLALAPSAAMAYTVTLGAGPVGEAPSRFEQAELPGSTFVERPMAGTLGDVAQESSFTLTDMDSDLRDKTLATLTRLGAREENGRIIITMSGDVLFDFDKADIRADARPTLAQIAEVLLALPDSPVQIIGHTDAKGSDDYNQDLSERRAVSVSDWLMAQGVEDSALTTSGEGESLPVAPNQNPDLSDNPEGRQKNRRVEFIIETGE